MSTPSIALSAETLERLATLSAQLALEQLSSKHLEPMRSELSNLTAEVRVLNAFVRGNGSKGLIARYDEMVAKIERFMTRDEFTALQAAYRQELQRVRDEHELQRLRDEQEMQRVRDEQKNSASFRDNLRGAKWAITAIAGLLLGLINFISKFVH